jgi:hypothetical protein
MRILEWFLSRNSPRLSTRAGALTVCLLAIPSLCYPATLTGTVSNKTTNRPDGGDVVALVGAMESLPEVARTRTDAAGRYRMELPGPGRYLVRVEHQKVTYFAPVPTGTAHADVDVYDVAPRVEGITTEADMRRVETDQQGLYVVENYFVSNNSSPSRTQFSPETYKLYLPAAAQIQSSGAMGPDGMPIASSLVPGNDKGQYTLVFPLRPGRTRFQVSYHLPYSGSYAFQSRVSLPTTYLAIALPKSMEFVAGTEASFQSLNGDDPNTQIFVTRNVEPSQSLAFTVSGNGALPRDAAQGQSDQAGSPPAEPAPDSRSGADSSSQSAHAGPLNRYKWWILSGLALALPVAGVFLLRSRKKSPPAAKIVQLAPVSAPPVTTAQSTLLDALKQELFVLETERLQGKLSENEYRKQKAAFESVLKRALIRISPQVAQKNSKVSRKSGMVRQ